MTTLPERRATRLCVAIAACVGFACSDGGSPSRTADEFAADSALAADLALANRDTLLVDSIGAYRPSEDVPLPVEDSLPVIVTPPPPGTSSSGSRPDVTPAPAPAPVPAPAPAPPPATKSAPVNAPRLSGTRACNSPTLENQSECLRALLPAADARMNRVYRALITEMRLQEKVPPGGKDPASVQRLRVAQRAWLVKRDTDCRRRGKGKEGSRWARPRVQCLGQFANRRANELADNFSRLTSR